MKNIPKRSEFTIDQFEKAFQKFAHEQPKFHRVSTEDMTINFYCDDQGKPRRISFQIHKHKPGEEWHEGEYWSFTIESKLYSTSSHSTKIDGNTDKAAKFLEELMHGQTPIPRFSLAQVKS